MEKMKVDTQLHRKMKMNLNMSTNINKIPGKSKSRGTSRPGTILLVLFLALVVLLSGCKQAEAEAGITRYTIAVTEEKRSLATPGIFERPEELTLLANLYLGLFAYPENLDKGPQFVQPNPVLAKAWEYSPDGLTFLVTLRSGYRWSNGEEITPESIRDGLLAAIKGSAAHGVPGDTENSAPILPGRYAYQYRVLDTSREAPVTLEEDGRLAFHLRRPYYAMEHLLAMPIFYPVTNVENPLAGPFSGPYQVEKETPNGLVLTPNPHYPGHATLPAEIIEMEYGVEPGKAGKGFTDKNYDVVFSPLPLESGGKGEILLAPGLRLAWLNGSRDALKTPEARKTLAAALDAGRILRAADSPEKNLSGLFSRPTVLPKASDGKASAPVDFSGTILTLLYLQDPTEEAMAREIQSQLQKKPGLTIQLNPQPAAEYFAALRSLSFDLALERLELEHYSPAGWFEIFVTPLRNPLNASGFIDTEINRLQQELAATGPDLEAREALHSQLESRILEVQPAAFISQGVPRGFWGRRLPGIGIHPIYGYLQTGPVALPAETDSDANNNNTNSGAHTDANNNTNTNSK